MELYFLALLPLGLLSAWLHRHENHRSTASFGFLAALAPVLAKGIGSLISHKQGKSAAKQAEEQRKLEAQQQDALARQQWEAQHNSPAAQAARSSPRSSLGDWPARWEGASTSCHRRSGTTTRASARCRSTAECRPTSPRHRRAGAGGTSRLG